MVLCIGHGILATWVAFRAKLASNTRDWNPVANVVCTQGYAVIGITSIDRFDLYLATMDVIWAHGVIGAKGCM